MILNNSIFTATIEAASTAAANHPDVLRAIDRAVIQIQEAAYWSFVGQTLAIQSTISKKLYHVDAAHTCEVRSKVCKHHIARLLMVRYTERLNYQMKKGNHVRSKRPSDSPRSRCHKACPLHHYRRA